MHLCTSFVAEEKNHIRRWDGGNVSNFFFVSYQSSFREQKIFYDLKAAAGCEVTSNCVAKIHKTQVKTSRILLGESIFGNKVPAKTRNSSKLQTILKNFFFLGR